MVATRIQLVDFMDARALPEGTVTLTLEVVPRFNVRLEDPEVRQRLQHDSHFGIAHDIPLGLRFGNKPPPGNTMVPIPNFNFAETFDVVGVTDDGGFHQTLFDVNDAFMRLSSTTVDGSTAVDVVAYLSVGFSFMGFDYDSRRLGEIIERPNASVEHIIPVDFGMCAVGHTTEDSTRLWFALNRAPTSEQIFRCVVVKRDNELESTPTDNEVDPRVVINGKSVLRPLTVTQAAAGSNATQALPTGLQIVFDELAQIQRLDETAILAVGQLEANRQYHYELQVHHGDRAFALMLGMFKTVDNTSDDRLRFSFGSCHLPAVPLNTADALEASDEQLERWQHLASRTDNELLLLLGDQIYGDGLEEKWQEESWFERYKRRYHQLWVYWPMRDVLRRTPNYMILDDHDVADDFGTATMDGARTGAAIEAYRSFQHARNPGGPEGAIHYSFKRGPASFFMLDGRTGRRPEQPGRSTMLLPSQLADLQAWARSPDTLASDVIFLVAPTPISLLPTELIRQLGRQALKDAAEVFEIAAPVAGVAVGASIGGLVAGPPGAFVGAVVLGTIGHFKVREVTENLPAELEQSALLKADLAERWDIAENQQQMVQVLDMLFDLANGVGESSPRRRAVFVLGGDIHIGTTHLIRSLPRGRGRQHSANPIITQITSSAISHKPVDRRGFGLLVSRITDHFSIALSDFSTSELWKLVFRPDDREEQITAKLAAALGNNPASYVLDSTLEQRFATDFSGMLLDHTIGDVGIERVGPGRRYRFQLGISGKDQSLDQTLEMDLESTDEDVPRFSSRDLRNVRIYLSIRRRNLPGRPTRPFANVAVQAINKGVPDPAQPSEPVIKTEILPKIERLTVTRYVPPETDTPLTGARTDRFGVVWFQVPAQVPGGELITDITETKVGNFPNDDEDNLPGQTTTVRTVRKLTARPDVYFRLTLPDGTLVDTQAMPGGLSLKARAAIGSADEPRAFSVLTVLVADPEDGGNIFT